MLPPSLLLVWLADPALAPSPLEPSHIVGGTDADACQWPTVVGMLVDGSRTICTGTLIHSQVVMTAAHCLIPEAPIDAVAFGEVGPDVGAPALVRDVVSCTAHPDWANFGAHDVAFCMLASPLGLEITPLLHGCERNVLVPGQEVVIVGFGSTFATVDGEGNIETIEGVGTKRFTTQTIHSLDDGIGVVNLVGPDGSQSACFGDSGGPALVRMADGTWRVFGAASTAFDPGGFGPPQQPGNACGVGVAYADASQVMDWLESSIGFDVTPCHDVAGTFTGGPGCGGFPLDIDQGGGDWNGGCFGGAQGGGEEVCEPFDGPIDPDPTGEPPEPPPPEPPPPDPTGEVPPQPVPPEPEDPSGTEGSSSSDGADFEAGLVSRGCGCAAPQNSGATWAWVLAVLGLRRRSARGGGPRSRQSG